MRHTILYAILLMLSINCTSKSENKDSILNLVPKSATLVLKINDYESLKEEFSTNEILKTFVSHEPFNKIKKDLQVFENFGNQSKGLLAFSSRDSSSVEYTYISKDSLVILNWDQLSSKSVETFTYSSYEITKYQINDATFYYTYLENNWLASSSLALIQGTINGIGTSEINTSLQKFYSVSNHEKILNIWFEFDKGEKLMNHLLGPNQHLSNFASWMSLDLTWNNSEILLNGIAESNADNNHFLNLFSDTKPIQTKTSGLLPADIHFFTTYGLEDFKKYIENKTANGQKETALDSLLYTVEEIVITEYENEKILFLRTYGTATLLDYIDQEKVSTEEYSGNEIWQLKPKSEIFNSIAPLIGEQSFLYSSIIENTFVFSKTVNALQSVLSKYKTGETFEKTALFKNAEKKLTSASSVLSISDLKGTVDVLNTSISETLGSVFNDTKFNDYVFSSQFIADAGFFHANFLIKKITQEEEQNSVSPVFEVQFNTDLATLPQFVTNHINGKKEIIVQDQDNTVYLISNTGKILWKKQLAGTIQGKVHQVDLFKNGKLQLAFTTNNQFLILDRNGNEVAPFTKKYSGGNLNPLALFDYDGRKNYRFVVTQNKNVFMYNGKGAIVKGFTYNTTEAAILDAPQHFRLAKKDYIVFKLDNGQLKITNRVGKTRIPVKNTFSFSDNDIKMYQNKFSFTSIDGILYQIDSKGNMASSNLNLAKDHGMDATSRTLAIMNDNILRIRGKKIQLELGVYSKPTIFYLNDKIYVSVTDIQNQKIYLFDSQAESIPNFPILGNSIIDMADIDNNKKAELVFKDQENSIKVFKIR